MKPTSSDISLIASFFSLTLRCWKPSLYCLFTPFLGLHTWPLDRISRLFLIVAFLSPSCAISLHHVFEPVPRPLCAPFLSSPCLPCALSSLVWNQYRSGWQCWWFMAHSKQTLIRCSQGTLCCWMTMENQSHYAPQPRPLAFWTLQITSSSLIYGRHFGSWEGHEGELGALCVCGGVEAAGSKAGVYVRPNVILKGTCWRCVLCAYVWI